MNTQVYRIFLHLWIATPVPKQAEDPPLSCDLRNLVAMHQPCHCHRIDPLRRGCTRTELSWKSVSVSLSDDDDGWKLMWKKFTLSEITFVWFLRFPIPSLNLPYLKAACVSVFAPVLQFVSVKIGVVKNIDHSYIIIDIILICYELFL